MKTGPDADDANPGSEPQAWQSLRGKLPLPADPTDQGDLLWQELAAQFRWYDRAATRTRLSYQVLKVAALVSAAVVTVLAAISAPAAITASLAAAVVVVEGIQQVFQFHSNWISYRATAEALRQHAFLYTANVDPYADVLTRRDKLAELMRNITSTEISSWASTMRQAAPPPSSTGL